MVASFGLEQLAGGAGAPVTPILQLRRLTRRVSGLPQCVQELGVLQPGLAHRSGQFLPFGVYCVDLITFHFPHFVPPQPSYLFIFFMFLNDLMINKQSI